MLDDPNYAPSSVEWYVEQVKLYLSNGTILQPSPNNINLLPTAKPGTGQPNPYLLIPDPSGLANSSVRNGDLTLAAAYVHLMQTPGTKGSSLTYDLQYWFFYPLRGMSTLRIQGPDLPVIGKTGDVNGDFSVPPSTESEPRYQGCGEHQGDWKTVTVRITAPSASSPNGRIVGVFYGQHASGIWCLPGEFDTTSTGRPGPVVYSARFTHSCFPKAGRFNQINFNHDYKVLQISLLEWTADGGDTWDCSQGLVVMADDTTSFTRPAWVSFYGYWGATCTQNPVYGFTNAISQCTAGSSYLSQVIEAGVSSFGPTIEGWFGRTENGAATPAMQEPYWSQGPGALPAATLPGQTSPFGAVLAGSADFLYAGWTGSSGDHLLYLWPSATGAFSGDRSSGQASKNNFALTLFAPPGQANPLLYAAWTGAGDSGPSLNVLPVTDSANKISWGNSNKTTLSSYKSNYSPALAAFAPLGTQTKSIYLAWAQQPAGDLLVLSSASGDFNGAQPSAVGGISATGPALVSFDGALRLVWTDSNNGSALTITSSASGTFSDAATVRLAHISVVTPAAVVFNNSLYLAWMENAYIWVWSSNDGSFSSGTTGPLVQIPSSPPAPGLGAPALTVYDNLLYLAWIDTNKAIHLMSSDDGVNFF